MIKYLFIILPVLSWAQNISIKPSKENTFKVDTNITAIAKKQIHNPKMGRLEYLFDTKFLYKFFTNNKLTESGSDTGKTFWTRYYWNNDSLHIIGAPEALSGGGFHAIILKDTSIFYHFSCGHTKYRLKKNLNDTLQLCVEVPCMTSKLVISNMPDSTKDKFIYGYVEFESGDYFYQKGLLASRLRENMKFYFRAYNFHFYKRRFYKNFQ